MLHKRLLSRQWIGLLPARPSAPGWAPFVPPPLHSFSRWFCSLNFHQKLLIFSSFPLCFDYWWNEAQRKAFVSDFSFSWAIWAHVKSHNLAAGRQGRWQAGQETSDRGSLAPSLPPPPCGWWWMGLAQGWGSVLLSAGIHPYALQAALINGRLHFNPLTRSRHFCVNECVSSFLISDCYCAC